MLPNKLEQLEEQLQDESVELTHEQVSERYKIDNLSSLDWAFRKLASNNAELAEKEAFKNAEIEKITSWFDAEKAKTEHANSFFEHLIAEYHASVLAEDSKKKSLSTPNGKVQSTTRKPAIVKPEKESLPQLIEYAEKNDFAEFIEVKKDLKWTEFKKELSLTEDLKVVDSNGQVVPNIPISEGRTTFKITTN